jgi:hypothetical protein
MRTTCGCRFKGYLITNVLRERDIITRTGTGVYTLTVVSHRGQKVVQYGRDECRGVGDMG